MQGSKSGACSSNTQGAKANCLAHNRREGRTPSYVNPDRTHLNRTVFEDAAISGRKSIVPLVRRAEKQYTEKTGQKCQKSFTPYRESCLVIRADTTDSQLLAFKEKAEHLLGWKCLGIWVHQDEGHAKSKYVEGDEGFAINHHAHVLWDCVDPDSGKAIRASRNAFSKMQDLLAEATGMERGNYASETGRRHRSTTQQRIQAEEQRIERLEAVAAQKNQDTKETLLDAAASLIGRGFKRTIKEQDTKIEAQSAEISRLTALLAQKDEILARKDKDAADAMKAAESVFNTLKAEYNKRLRAMKDKMKTAEEGQKTAEQRGRHYADILIKGLKEDVAELIRWLAPGDAAIADHYKQNRADRLWVCPMEQEAIREQQRQQETDNSENVQNQNTQKEGREAAQEQSQEPRRGWHR